MRTSPMDGAALAPVIPIAFARRKGGPAWRRAQGLQHWTELVREYAERRFIRSGSLVPLPEDLLHGWRCP